MTVLPQISGAPSAPRNTILHGDCVTLMDTIPDNNVDLIVTDPPYLVNYRPRSGHSLPMTMATNACNPPPMKCIVS